MNSLLVVLVVVVASVAADRVPDFVIKGKCPDVDETKLWKEQQPQHSKFGGTWYQYAITNNPYQLLDQCIRLQYDYDGKGFKASATGLTPEGKLLKRYGKIAPMPLGDPHLMVAFEDSFPAPLVILDTDFDNYACLYSCMDYNFGYYSDFSFIFTRNPTPSETYVKKCEAIFKKIGVDTNRFLKTTQGTTCSYEKQEL